MTPLKEDNNSIIDKVASMPLVSIYMIVYNGERFLSEALESLVAQDYNNIEIVILDNMSEDNTKQICQSFSKLHSNIEYIEDDRRVDAMDGVKRVIKYTSGDYIMPACDDDIYEASYVSTLMSLMLDSNDIGLVYSQNDFVSEEGVISLIDERNRGQMYTLENSVFRNFFVYLMMRTPIPIALGIYRRDIFNRALKYYYRVDHRGWDHDNLLMLKVLSISKVNVTNSIMFHYRQRDRSVTIPHDLPANAFLKYIYYVRHQILFSAAVMRLISGTEFKFVQKFFLHTWNIIVLGYFVTLRYFRSSVKNLISNNT